MPTKENPLMVKLIMLGAATIDTQPKVAKIVSEIAVEVEDLQKEFAELLEACTMLVKLEACDVNDADTRWKKAKNTIKEIVQKH